MAFSLEVFLFATVIIFGVLWWLRHLLVRIENTMVSSLWAIEDRCDKTANKAEKLELRAMDSALRVHEVLRKWLQLFQEFDIEGDATWLPRQLADLMTNLIEVRMRQYGGTRADGEAFCRFIMRVAVDRSLNLKYVRRS